MNGYVNIAGYFVFAECIECRLAMLTGERSLYDFYEEVYPYISRILGFKDTEGRDINFLEGKMWAYAIAMQAEYSVKYREVFRSSSKNKFVEIAKVLKIVNNKKVKLGVGSLNIDDVKAVYDKILDMDDFKSSFAGVMSNLLSKKEESRIFCIADKYRAEIINLMSGFHECLSVFTRLEEKLKGTRPPMPDKLLTSLAIFSSHIGRAVCNYYGSVYCDDKSDEYKSKMNTEIEGATTHLRRGAMDAYKWTFDYLRRNQNTCEKKISDALWKMALTARIKEHEREPISERLKHYNNVLKLMKKHADEVIDG